MNYCIALLIVSFFALSTGGQVLASPDEERSVQQVAECPIIDGKYHIYGKQLSGPDVGSKYGPSLIRNVFWSYRVHQPGIRSLSLRIKLLDASRLVIASLGPEQAISHENELCGHCDQGWFVLSATTTGGSEGHYGTTRQVIQLKTGTNGSLITNVKTVSKGRDFFVFPHNDSSDHAFEFYRVGD